MKNIIPSIILKRLGSLTFLPADKRRPLAVSLLDPTRAESPSGSVSFSAGLREGLAKIANVFFAAMG